MTVSFEEYVKTAAQPYNAPSMGAGEKIEPTLMSRAGKYIKAHPWRAGGMAAGGLGLGLLAHQLLGGGDEPETPQAAELPEETEPEIGGMPSFVGGGLERGVGGAITEGAKALGRAAYLGGRRLLQGRRQGQVFDQVRSTDPILSEADPEVVQQSFSTMARFAPTLASDPYAVQSFLREAVTSGGGINYNTLKLLAEAERAAQQV